MKRNQEIQLQSAQAQMQAQMQQQQQALNDPFRQYEQYNSIPDNPVSYGNSLAESLLNDNEVPDEIKKEFWYVFHKDNTLTFLDENRKMQKLLAFDIAKIDSLNTIPYYDYDFQLELKLGVLRNVFETKLDRALGMKQKTGINERIVLQSQFSEQKQIHEEQNTPAGKVGFFKRLLSRR